MISPGLCNKRRGAGFGNSVNAGNETFRRGALQSSSGRRGGLRSNRPAQNGVGKCWRSVAGLQSSKCISLKEDTPRRRQRKRGRSSARPASRHALPICHWPSLLPQNLLTVAVAICHTDAQCSPLDKLPQNSDCPPRVLADTSPRKKYLLQKL